MNSATVRATRAHKHQLLSNPTLRATLQSDAKLPVILFDDLPQRWERLVAKGHA